jgi:hypothetical protein
MVKYYTFLLLGIALLASCENPKTQQLQENEIQK